MSRHWGAKARTRDRTWPWCISRGHAGTPGPQARRSASAGIFPRGRADRSEKPAPPLKTELHCCSVVCLTRPARQLAYGRLFALGNRAGVVRKSFPPESQAAAVGSVSASPASPPPFFLFSHTSNYGGCPMLWFPDHCFSSRLVPSFLFSLVCFFG